MSVGKRTARATSAALVAAGICVSATLGASPAQAAPVNAPRETVAGSVSPSLYALLGPYATVWWCDVVRASYATQGQVSACSYSTDPHIGPAGWYFAFYG